MKNIKNIYQHSCKCDYQQNLKNIIYAAMVSTPEGVIDNIPNAPMTTMSFKKPSASKSLYIFTNILDIKPKKAKRRFVAAKYKRISINVGKNL